MRNSAGKATAITSGFFIAPNGSRGERTKTFLRLYGKKGICVVKVTMFRE
jgi:hypothetical protein